MNALADKVHKTRHAILVEHVCIRLWNDEISITRGCVAGTNYAMLTMYV